MVLAPFYRTYELPWEGEEDTARRFRKLLASGLVLLLVVGLLVPLLQFPDPRGGDALVPQRLARIMVEERTLPPPTPPPPVQPQPVQPTAPVATPRPQPVAPPVDRSVEARRRAEQSGLVRMRDQLADLRREFATEPAGQARNLSGAVGAQSRAERSLITSRAGSGSAGVRSADSSAGFGSGAGSLAGHEVGAVDSRVMAGTADAVVRGSAGSGKAARSQEEVELEFDRNKGAIYALYSRALRARPELQGKLVLEFTIAPSGEVTDCRVVSSDLDDAELERRIVARVRAIRFEARDVAPLTTTKPIEFFPA